MWRHLSCQVRHGFRSQQTHIIPTPIRAPNAISYAERWIRSVREACLDKILILNEAHLRRVLNVYLAYYNKRRPHQGLEQQSPIPRPEPETTGEVKRRQILGGIINDYFRSSDKTAVYPA